MQQPTVRPSPALQDVPRPMEAVLLHTACRHIDSAWQGASPLQRRLAVATATALRRSPHPLKRTGTAQHHLSPMRASSAKRHNAGGERARARRKAAWCRCRKASFLAPPAWFLASWSVATVAAFPLRAPSPRSLNVRPADATRADCGQKLAYVYECAALTVGPKNV